MSSFTATNTPLAGLGLSFDALPVESSFSSGEESFDSLFSDVTLASSGTGSSSPPSDWRLAAYHAQSDSDWDESEPDAGFNYFEPYLGLPEVADFMPWPTSPDTAIQNTEAVPEPETPVVPATPNDHGYETDTEGTTGRAQRRQRRRDAHKLPRRQRAQALAEHTQPIIEESPSLEERHHWVASPILELEEEDVASLVIITTTTITTTADEPASLEADVSDSEEAFVELELEQDITDCYQPSDPAPAPSTSYQSSPESESDVELELDTDAYDSDDSDVDRYLYDSDGNVDLDALANGGLGPVGGEVHYTAERTTPIIEELPSLDELRARTSPSTIATLSEREAALLAGTEPSHPAHVGLGISLGLLPLPAPLNHAASAHYDDGFETIDLADDAPAPASVPAAPALRPYLAEGSPSPIVLASPAAAFRRFDDVAEPVYAARQSIV